MSYLLDVNYLVAMFDARHVNHDAAHRWFETFGTDWVTCSITENGCVRILSSPAYPTVSATPRDVLERLARFCAAGGHSFWADDQPLRLTLDADLKDRLQGHRQLTDFHLAVLAAHRNGHLVTFDGRLLRSLTGTRLEGAVVLVE